MLRIALSISLLFMLTACERTVTTEGQELPAVELRIATFNIAMGLAEPGELGRALRRDDDPRLLQIAEILQRVRPDILLLNEFDYDPDTHSASLFNQNYLSSSHNGQQVIHYPYSFRAAVNTGTDSGMDLDGNGVKGEPNDAYGYGVFPGQYGMLVLSRHALKPEKSREFRRFLWSALPDAKRPAFPDGTNYHSDEVWAKLRLSSKSHWDLTFNVKGHDLHLLAYHPTPPVFDGPEDRNGKRNFDETRFWLEYIQSDPSSFVRDDDGMWGSLAAGEPFLITGDLNADPLDGDSLGGAIGQLLNSPLIDSTCLPLSDGAAEASTVQGGVNSEHQGNPGADSSDFDDRRVGNLRLDYLLPSAGLTIRGCGVFWPSSEQDGHDLVDASDHRLVWLDIAL